MSGINEMKEKIKKKLSLDDMTTSHTEVISAVNTAVQPNGYVDEEKNIKENLIIQQNVQQYSKPQYTKKMTLYLTEELYKSFNDIYAKRMLEGRKTDKSVLICEAIQLLVEQESFNKI